MRDAQFAKAVLVGEVGHEIHLRIGRIARRNAGFFQRDGDDGIAIDLVRAHIAADPVGERLVFVAQVLQCASVARQVLVSGRREIAGHAIEFVQRDRARAFFQVDPFGLDLTGEFFHAQCLHQNLDACLVLVVATAVLVIHAHDRFNVGEQMLPGQEIANHAADDRGTTEAAAHQYLKAQLAGRVLHQIEADVMRLHRSAVFCRRIHGELEFARYPGADRPAHLRPRRKTGRK